MKLRSVFPMRAAKIGYVFLSALMIALGTAFIVLPQESAVWLIRALGVLFMIFGVIKLVGYFSKDLYRLAFQYDLEFGIVLILTGAVITVHPAITLGIISALFGVVAVLDGLFKSRIALESKRFGISGWWLIMALGVLSDLAGIVLIVRPAESVCAIAVMLGASLIADGLLNLAVALETVKIVKKQYPDIIDPDYTETEDDIR